METSTQPEFLEAYSVCDSLDEYWHDRSPVLRHNAVEATRALIE